MDKQTPLQLQEIIFSSSDPNISREINKFLREGKLRKLAPRIYSPNLEEAPEEIVRRNIFKIIGALYHGTILSHRSALEFRPTSSGDLFLTGSYTRNIELPGVKINITKGPGVIKGDYPFSGDLYVSQQERALLENLQPSKKIGPSSKSLSLPEVEERLDQIVRVNGEDALNVVRDRAHEIAEELGMYNEYDKLNRIISAILTTRPSDLLTSPVAIARAFGHPYDPNRLALFEKLFVELQQHQFADRMDYNKSTRAFKNFAFFESYFSNFIEDTKFRIEEAMQIVKTGRSLPARDEDSHDVLGTYQIVSNRNEMMVTPDDPDHLFEILQYRHRILLNARPHKNPGEFKNINNRAGETDFVDQSLVRGTLTQGFDFYRVLQHPFAKAAYLMFMISEVHPFLDGNGRIARVMMNAELTSKGHSKILIPTVFREDYMGGLRQLTRRQEPGTYIRMMQRAQLFSSMIYGEDIDQMQEVLKASNAFEEGDDYILKVVTDG